MRELHRSAWLIAACSVGCSDDASATHEIAAPSAPPTVAAPVAPPPSQPEPPSIPPSAEPDVADEENHTDFVQLHAASFDALKPELLAQHAEATDFDDPSDVTVEIARRLALSEGHQAAIILTSTREIGGLAWVAFSTATEWTAIGPIDQVAASGAGATTGSIRALSLEARQLIAGDAEEVIAVVSTSYSDDDMGDNARYTTEGTTTALCGLTAGTPTCFAAIPTQLRDRVQASSPRLGPGPRPVDDRRELRLSFPADGRVRIDAVRGAIEPGVTGEFPLTDLPAVLRAPFTRRDEE